MRAHTLSAVGMLGEMERSREGKGHTRHQFTSPVRCCSSKLLSLLVIDGSKQLHPRLCPVWSVEVVVHFSDRASASAASDRCPMSR